jgi:WD40 repeat protein
MVTNRWDRTVARPAILCALVILVSSAAAEQPENKPPSEPVSPRLVRTLVHPDPNSPIWLLRYSSDGRRLAAGGYPSGILQIWDPTTGQELSRMTPPNGERGTAEYGALTADWKTAFTPYEVQKVLRVDGPMGPQKFANYDGAVRVWDVTTGKPRPPISVAVGRGVNNLWASPDGTKLVTVEVRSHEVANVQRNPLVVVYRDLARDGPPIELADGFGMAAFAPDGKTIVLTTGGRAAGESRIRLFDAQTGKETTTLAAEPKASIFFPAFSPDSKRIAAEVRNLEETASTIRVWDRDTGKEVAVLKPAEASLALYPDFSASGGFVTAIAKGGTAYVWNVASGKVVVKHSFGASGSARAVAISPDNRLASMTGTPGGDLPQNLSDDDPVHHLQPRVILYDLATGKLIETLICPPGFPAKAAFSPDGKTLAVGGSGAVHLFNVADITGRGR